MTAQAFNRTSALKRYRELREKLDDRMNKERKTIYKELETLDELAEANGYVFVKKSNKSNWQIWKTEELTPLDIG